MCFGAEGSRESRAYCFSTMGSSRSCQNRFHEKLATSSDTQEPSWVFGTKWILLQVCKGLWEYCSSINRSNENDVFTWKHVAECAFDKLKQAMCTTPIPAMPDFSNPFTIESDACDNGIGVVLLQDEHPIAFTNKSLSGRNLATSTYEK